MERREPPQTDEGWYALHDFRTVDWDAWREAPARIRERATAEGVEFLTDHEALADAEEGASAVFSILGHKADLLILHLRPTMAHLDVAERQFEQTAFAQFTEQTSSYVSVTEVSGYMSQEYFEEDGDVDTSIARYIQSRIKPDIPDAEFVSFYPMSKRRGPEDNWYDLPFDERADHLSAHGEIGKQYAGKVKQVITGSIGMDDWEWGVTLFADDLTDVKQLLNEMRFDPSTSRFAEFGQFYVGRRFPPADLEAYLAGEHVPTGTAPAVEQKSADSASSGGKPPVPEEDTHEEVDRDQFEQELRKYGVRLDEYPETGYGLIFESTADAEDLAAEVSGLRTNFDHYDTHVMTAVRADAGHAGVISLWKNKRAADTASGFLSDLEGVQSGMGAQIGEEGGTESDDEADETASHGTDEDADLRAELEDLNIYSGQPHGEDVYAMVLYSEADPQEVYDEVDGMRERFDHYDTHVKTAVYDAEMADKTAIVSIWKTQSAANTAGGFLADLPGIVARAGEESGFGTMGMFYTVKPEHREDFVEKFEVVGGLLDDMDGHLETALLANLDDENDMFIASQWRDKEDAMAFFRSEAFRDTVQWGRDILADRPRHVFLA
ncbi:heme-binding protein [Haladaptatus sp. DYSN1]|uniref:heme-binding protein n=1 Tax=unclassified Haladaptatus TaxID=2622732 RepID=UPI0024068532|nr:heme-binding protein [Haladaptatus sp. DYSN1]